MVKRTDCASLDWFGAISYLIMDVNLTSPLDADEGGKQPDGAGPKDQYAAYRASGHPVDLLPCLSDNTRWFDEHGAEPKGRVYTDRLISEKGVPLRSEAV